MASSSADHGHFETSLSPLSVTGATAVAGVNTTSLSPSIERDSGYHDHSSDRLPMNWYAALNPATGSSVPVTPFATVQQATPLIPDVVVTITIVCVVVVLCVALLAPQVRCLSVTLRLRTRSP
jgi:hypothetical protein